MSTDHKPISRAPAALCDISANSRGNDDIHVDITNFLGCGEERTPLLLVNVKFNPEEHLADDHHRHSPANTDAGMSSAHSSVEEASSCSTPSRSSTRQNVSNQPAVANEPPHANGCNNNKHSFSARGPTNEAPVKKVFSRVPLVQTRPILHPSPMVYAPPVGFCYAPHAGSAPLYTSAAPIPYGCNPHVCVNRFDAPSVYYHHQVAHYGPQPNMLYPPHPHAQFVPYTAGPHLIPCPPAYAHHVDAHRYVHPPTTQVVVQQQPQQTASTTEHSVISTNDHEGKKRMLSDQAFEKRRERQRRRNLAHGRFCPPSQMSSEALLTMQLLKVQRQEFERKKAEALKNAMNL